MSILTIMDITLESDSAILAAIGERLRRIRLDLNLTRDALAESVGVSSDTVRNVEAGSNTSLETLLRLLRGLGKLDELAPLLADEGPSPVQLARRRGVLRQRATGSRGKSPDDRWQW